MTDGEAAAGPAPERKDASGAEPEPDAGATSHLDPDVETSAMTEAPEPVTVPSVAAEEEPGDAEAEAMSGTGPIQPRIRARRRRDPLASALIGILTLLLGFAFAVQVRSADTPQVLAGAREEDLVRILDELNAREDRLRGQIAEQRTALEQLTNSDSQSATALDEARRRAEAIGILNGTVAARGPGLRMDIGDPDGVVRVEDMLDAIEELRGAGAETMQLDGVRVGVSTAITGQPRHLLVDGRPITAPYEFLVIGSPQDMETAMNIPGGVVQRVTGLGGTVRINQQAEVSVDALRPLDTPQYASPKTGK
ncbi:MAG: hypothetical protein QOJ68_2843 [Blastococcus sp.]|nr:hypothetical protein [Blastococcus sp.]